MANKQSLILIHGLVSAEVDTLRTRERGHSRCVEHVNIIIFGRQDAIVSEQLRDDNTGAQITVHDMD